MAIKIIDTTPSPKVVKQVICQHCGVTLEYTPADTRKQTIRDYGGGSDTYKFIDCPKCNHAINVTGV
jgi:5-methylcytosine-specific restriction endonuclease McrA